MSNIYSVSFSSIEATGVAQDIFHVLASTISRIKIMAIHLAQSTADYVASGEIELLALSVLRGSTTPAGGTTGSFLNIDRRGATAVSKVTMNCTTPGEVGTEQLLFAGSLQTGEPFHWQPHVDGKPGGRDARPVIGLGERLSVRLGPSSAVITLNGTLTIEEIGKVPGE